MFGSSSTSLPCSTTPDIPGREVSETLGIVAGEAVLGANVFRDLFAGIRDFVGGRAGGYQKVLRAGRGHALDDMMEEARELGADAIVGIDIDYEAIGSNGSMLMVSMNGTAVKLR
ncbi:heavy metal-binding domain-containing protein [Rhizobiaceae bacterium]|nr:heavy metal-binding domain-containing protein [Rhizobiaceae bacterium]